VNGSYVKTAFVADLASGTPVRDLFLLAEAKSGNARNGPYWSLTLQDATGRVEAKIWSPHSQAHTELPAGRLVLVSGQCETFRDKLQLNLDSLTFVDNDAPGVDLGWFVPVSAVRPEELLTQMEELLRCELTFKPWRKFCRRVLGDPDIRARLLAGFGAKSVHHAYLGGLLEHTLSVARLCLTLADRYPELDREVLLVGAVFHDLGKAWEIEGGMVSDYTDDGRLLGHIIIGLEKLEPHLLKSTDLPVELARHFKHIIVSHHGQYEFGSPKLPVTAEAMVLHYADNLDAKLHMFQAAYRDLEKSGQQWSPYHRYLDRQVYLPPRTPREERADKSAKKLEGQCSLPLKA
jgi:3'-5' exoribonuclease